RQAVAAALQKPRPLTHVAHGAARVERVASNRRVALSPEGKVKKMRGSACKDPELIALPDGLIDPMLKTIAFYEGETKRVACHYYATHPMSYYGDGRVSADFAGLARKQRQHEEPDCTHIYFTGCAGNIAAGKYNEGTKEARVQLTRRIHDGMVASETSLRPEPIGKASWRTHEILPPPNPLFVPETLREAIANPKHGLANRIRPAFTLSWMERVEQKMPLMLSALHIDNISMLHLPAEAFIEYQLRAQAMQPKRVVATAAYGDGGPWYLPTREAYPQGGYEVSVAFCADAVDGMLTDAVRALLS
nr:hypothetical protein [Verrucomicrobiota bacterium]